MDFSIISNFVQDLPASFQKLPASIQDLAARDPQGLLYGAAGLLSAVLLLLYVVRGRRSRDGKPLEQNTKTSHMDRRTATSQTQADTKARIASSADGASELQKNPQPAPTQHLGQSRRAPLMLASTNDIVSSETRALDLSEFGVYAPHFDFNDSDAFKMAIKEVREAQNKVASDEGITIADPEATVQEPANIALDRLAARAYRADCDAAIATVTWNTIEQREERLSKTQASIDAMLLSAGRIINPAFATLKLKELRLTHEQREKLKEEKETRAELARLKKEEALLTKDATLAEKEEVRLQQAVAKANQAAQKATGEEAFELEARAGELTRELETAHHKAERARDMVQQSNAGYLYVISNVGAFGEGVFKIGISRRPDPDAYIEDLGQESVPFPYDTHATIYSDDAASLRDTVYAALDDKRMNRTGRHNGFFTATLDDITTELTRLVPDAEISSSAEAQGYHQTLAQLRQNESGAG